MRAAAQPAYFFYGTLMDADIRRVVLGPDAEPLRIEPAILSGYRRVRATGGIYPILLRSPRGRLNGLLVHGIGALGSARLAHFEAAEYRLASVVVLVAGRRRQAACVFLPSRAVSGRSPWRFTAWWTRYKRQFLSRATTWMRRFEPPK